ncbi:hypothetical protein CU044_4285 [Streptomyces sp. L-9-10]|uniref:hypothetical protein n=1 Tax=unclassified Streptomyces TaxID=2593676 RepID=UPI00101D8A28|nr:hypothetical protein [Streptomyces sp. L-9-10]RYJ25400.1 hypothetical protein CU044_4285 [Streptomyces sp. L-9-10]
MDHELMALASTAATTVVSQLATDGWEQVKRAVAALWRRSDPDDPEQAEAVERELAESRAELLAALIAGDEQAERILTAQWSGRLRGLLAASPALADALRQVLAEIGTGEPRSETGAGRVDMHATASDHAKVFQAARDQHISGA